MLEVEGLGPVWGRRVLRDECPLLVVLAARPAAHRQVSRTNSLAKRLTLVCSIMNTAPVTECLISLLVQKAGLLKHRTPYSART